MNTPTLTATPHALALLFGRRRLRFTLLFSNGIGRLIEYLRATVPRLDERAARLDEELRRVEAYLELMHMRMPDRLHYALHVDEGARAVHCPPMTLLTLVENAVRHGIDPAEDGGTIEIRVELRGERCVARVSDTGIGLHANGNGLGTGVALAARAGRADTAADRGR